MRIVSLCPSLTELLHDLGAADDVVGRTKFCIHPAPWVDGIEKLGGTKNPKLERIIALAPDLVVMNEEENRAEDARALRDAGIAVHSSMPRTAAETARMVRDIAAAIGRAATGEQIAHDIESRTARVMHSAAGLAEVSYAYLIWREPWMSVNDDTFIAALLAQAGGCNVFGAMPERYPTITLDALAAARPARVFLSSEPFPFTPAHADALAAETGLARETFVFVDGELLSWHGSRTPAGIDYAESLIAGARGAATSLAADRTNAS
jgi:iron complex transport system substrate-binding protein